MDDFIGGVRFARSIFLIVLGTVSMMSCKAQVAPVSTPQNQTQSEESGTSTDLFVMLGSDLDRPGWVLAANHNIGIDHTFAFLKKNPIGDEITFAYTYESGGPTFWHSTTNSDTESLGIMKNFGLPKTKLVTGYTWVQMG